MEPSLITAPSLLVVLEELKRLEPIFHTPAFGVTRSDVERMMDDSFWEVGASGRRYSRAFVLEALEARTPSAEEGSWETRDFHCLEIAPDNFLLTYTLLQGSRVTRRCTIWRRTNADWRIVYHQGTLVESSETARGDPSMHSPESRRR
jgi:hypothetical protein